MYGLKLYVERRARPAKPTRTHTQLANSETYPYLTPIVIEQYITEKTNRHETNAMYVLCLMSAASQVRKPWLAVLLPKNKRKDDTLFILDLVPHPERFR